MWQSPLFIMLPITFYVLLDYSQNGTINWNVSLYISHFQKKLIITFSLYINHFI